MRPRRTGRSANWPQCLSKPRRSSASTKSAKDVQKIEHLVKELGSDLKTEPGLEIRWRLGLLLARLDAETTPEESLRTLRAIETLEHSATSESREVLEMLVSVKDGIEVGLFVLDHDGAHAAVVRDQSPMMIPLSTEMDRPSSKFGPLYYYVLQPKAK
jgi:hypothetical protein